MRTRGQHVSTSCLAVGAALYLLVRTGFSGTSRAGNGDGSDAASPIEHVVVIFQENVSFDHYFATYPVALNPTGEPFFQASDDTPSVNGLGTLINGQPEGVLLTNNPNSNNPANGSEAINPFRLDRSQASTCDQDHSYGDEQRAFDQGLMDAFPANTGFDDCGGYDSARVRTWFWGTSTVTRLPRCGTTLRISYLTTIRTARLSGPRRPGS
jgi:phospholipase C